MKFNLDTAWKDASQLMKDNFSLMAIVAGVFFFLPYALMMVALPEFAQMGQMGGAPADPDAMGEMVLDLYATYWWAFLLMMIFQGIGFLALLSLLRRRANPTVGEALSTGVRSVPSYLAVQLLQALGLGIVIGAIVGLAAVVGGVALAVLAGLIGFVLFLYVFTKLSLASAVIAMDGVLNPLTAMSNSWRLTKGNSVRLFFFYFLVVLAFMVASMVISLVTTLVFALGGPDVALFGTAIVSSVINAGFIMLFAALLAAVYMQLTRLRSNTSEMEAGVEG